MNGEHGWTCPLCGAVSTDGRTCEEQFHAFLFLESQYMEAAAQVHHLMVASYMLQHNAYSDEGRAGVIGLMEDWLERGITPQQSRQQQRDRVNSGNRNWKITGTSSAHFTSWPMTAMDVNSDDPAQYVKDVEAWARAVLGAIRARA